MAGSSASYSTGSSYSNPTVVQTPQSEWGLQLSQLLAALGSNQYNWAMSQFNNGMGITDANIAQYMDLAGKGAGLAQNLLSRYTDVFEPIMDKYIQEAGSYNSEDRQRFMMGQAESTTGQADKAALDANERKLQSFGINPNSGRYMDLLQTSRLQDAAARAGAGTQASQHTSDVGRQMTQTAAQMGQNVPGMTVNALQSAYTGVTGAENAILGMLNTGANLTNSAAPFFNAASGAIKMPAQGQQSRSQQQSRSGSVQTNPSSGSSGNQRQPSGGGRGAGGYGAGRGASNQKPSAAGTSPGMKTMNGPFSNEGPAKIMHVPGDGSGDDSGQYSPSTNYGGYIGNAFAGVGNGDFGPNGSLDPSIVSPWSGSWDTPAGGTNQWLPPDFNPDTNNGANIMPFSGGQEVNPDMVGIYGFPGASAWNNVGNPLAGGNGGTTYGGSNYSPSTPGQYSTDQSAFSGPGVGYTNSPFMGNNWSNAGNYDFGDTSQWTNAPDMNDVTSSIGNQQQSSYGFQNGNYGGSSYGGGNYGYTQSFGQNSNQSSYGGAYNGGSYGGAYSAGSYGGGGSSYGGGGGYYGGGYYAAGGKVKPRARPSSGGPVPRSASPSRGKQTDDIPARLNAGEFVVPRDVVAHKGTEFFKNLIAKSRRARLGMSGPAPKAKMKPALRMKPSFVSRGA